MEATTDKFTSTDSKSTRDRSRTQRVFIREMILRNFKSYASEQRVSPFHESFTTVVGPNRSGKSNAIDAMLFVFGKLAKQVISSLRPSLFSEDYCYGSIEVAEWEGK
ncbi:structural maintenance of chromosome 3 [Actinidia rufa]|uniref:Structural maintenance of chromosome 3 n=1 Tax=Actinidia rufa TaxID=165716 RepID=A0A7J0E267_9ERIC|nr:structural maintenance of chromosome 3 [Actinidia rufa]